MTKTTQKKTARKLKESPFGEGDGKLYIKTKYAGMSPLVPYIDGLPLMRFGKSKTSYMEIDVAIEWHEREIKASGGKWDRGVLDVLLEAKRNFEVRRAAVGVGLTGLF